MLTLHIVNYKNHSEKPLEMTDKYSEIKAKFDLPEKEDYFADFQVTGINEAEYPLLEIVEKVSEKIEHHAKFMEDLIQPESSLSAYHEAAAFDDKKNIYDLFKRLMYHLRNLYMSEMQDDESKAQALKSFLKEWQKMKPEVLKIMKRIRDRWEEEDMHIPDSEYLG